MGKELDKELVMVQLRSRNPIFLRNPILAEKFFFAAHIF